MTSEFESEFINLNQKWKEMLNKAENAIIVADLNKRKAIAKTAIRNGEGLAELYEKLIKACDEKTLWTNVVSQNPHPGWIKKKEDAINAEKEIRDEWDTAHKEALKSEEELNFKSTEYSQLKKNYTAWIKEMEDKYEYLNKKEIMRQQTKKID